jgi:hypothetical protein
VIRYEDATGVIDGIREAVEQCRDDEDLKVLMFLVLSLCSGSIRLGGTSGGWRPGA